MREKVTMSWSGGKDASFALYRVLTGNEYEVVGLHTTFDKATRRVGLHGVDESLIEEQAKSIGLPLTKLYLESSEHHGNYERLMTDFYRRSARAGVKGVVFGDIFLEDLKQYREQLLRPSGLFPVFPLWGIDTRLLVEDFINSGFKAKICSANAGLFAESSIGAEIDRHFLDGLAEGIDPCGENGEFHTFVFDGPIFKDPLHVHAGAVEKHGYTYRRKNGDGTTENLERAFWFQDFSLLTVS
ncbi:MAG: diphthine--ammonia ligase [Bacteroidia bacterium]|nr:diphthine--ammonia ligase [Bacteroidia bacterium]